MQFLGIFFFLGMVLEFSSLFLMVNLVGGLAVFGLIVLGMVSGGALLRHNLGVAKMMMAGQFVRGGGVSFYDMMLPVRIPLAGFLLAVPTGFLSSLLGLFLLIPFQWGRKVSPQNQSFSYEFYRADSSQNQQRHRHDDDIIEGEYTVKQPSQRASSHDVIDHQQ